MAAKQKYYVVWIGHTPGIYSSWEACRKQVEGFQGARYKSYKNEKEAQQAFSSGPENYKENQLAKSYSSHSNPPIESSISVDAACSGNPGKMEYRGVFTETNTELFKSKVYEQGTNNIGEFLAIVHGLAWQQKHKTNYPIYSDSRNAINWVKAGKAKTKLAENQKTKELFEVIRRAENWLKNNNFRSAILKWETDQWGEIPADFGRK
ncbi:MAG: ribonuclease H family protein [Bacteroidales bacterium]|jgi:ribonuclease HI|nr:ribonuclease H family protein [Bacteroidales bacterium]HOI33387.1 ribonuclease H family protein [Bacteroidales bacterium]